MAESMQGLSRTCRCGELSVKNAGDPVTVMGWVSRNRNKGGLVFTDLRDRSGVLQIVFEEGKTDPEVFEKAQKLRSEDVIAVVGKVSKRAGAVNEDLATGEIEVIGESLRVLSQSLTPPFPIEDKIATKEDDTIELRSTDTIIIASPAVPGTEREEAVMEDDLYKESGRVLDVDAKRNFTMHASIEDLKMMIYLMKPKYYIPVKGEYRQLIANANIALGMGYNADKIIVLDNGQVATLEDGQLKRQYDMIQTDDILIDGKDNLDASGMILKDRELLSTDGAIIIGIVINHTTKEIIGGPDVQSRGVIYLKDADYIVKEVGNIMERTINDAVAENRYDNMSCRAEAREKISRYVMRETGKRPMILPAIVEINTAS